ncbi:general stress protein [candidate division GN15 bacterium]|nr:general stress protein [candidate division GN15 bacterium]
MERLKIDSLGRECSRIGLGTWAIGGWLWGGTDEAESIKTIQTALDKGIDLVDTAPIYGLGGAEEIVGKAIKQYGGRDKITLVTKVGLEWDEDEKVKRNSSPERINFEIEQSLKRLQTDYIDLYLVHWPDRNTDFEETASALAKLKTDGKVRHVGVSNYDPAQMEAFAKGCPIDMLQPPYNIFEREIDANIVPYCRDKGIPLLTYGVLCRGLLSGKITADREYQGDDLRQVDPKFKQPKLDQYLAAVEKLDQFARYNYDRRVIHLAVRWVLDQGIEVALWGARRPDQLEALDKATDFTLDEDARAEVVRIVESTVPEEVGPEFMAPPK